MRVLEVKLMILLATPLLLLACVGRGKPTAEQCQELLSSSNATRGEIAAFVDKSRQFLQVLSEAESSSIAAERLGLCTGALARKVGR